jgi:hypothetical protein
MDTKLIDTKLKVVDIEDKDGQVLAAFQALVLREEELIAAQKAVDEANEVLGIVAAEALKTQSLKLSFGELIYVPKYSLTFIGDHEDDIKCIVNKKYEKFI